MLMWSILCLVGLLLACASAWADVLTTVDPDGRTRYTVVHTVPTLAESQAGIRYPGGADMETVRERIRQGLRLPQTWRREEDGRWSVTMPTTEPYRGVAGAAAPGVVRDPSEIRQAKEAYEASLERMQQEPFCVECRQDALAKGRAYRALGRPDGRLTLDDEAAIANDLTAVTGGRY